VNSLYKTNTCYAEQANEWLASEAARLAVGSKEMQINSICSTVYGTKVTVTILYKEVPLV
jgi:hypothetical protein